MCSRAFHDATGAFGSTNGISSVSSASPTTRYRCGTSRRDSTFRVAKHFTYEYGEEQYVKTAKQWRRKFLRSFSRISVCFSGFPVHHVLSNKQAEHGPRRFLQRSAMRGSTQVRSPRSQIRGQSYVRFIQRGSDHRETAARTTGWKTAHSVYRLHSVDF